MMRLVRYLLLLAISITMPLSAASLPDDPLKSPAWAVVYGAFFNDDRVVFDDRIKVITPDVAEDPMNVPVAVRVESGASVEKILIFADLNPIRKVAQFYPGRSSPYVAFRMRLEQSSPVRAAVLMKDGVWRIGGAWVSTTGGGCTAPSGARVNSNDWEKHLGEVQGRIWDNAAAGERVRLRVSHPMDTGLVAGIPPFFIEHLTLSDGKDKEYLRIDTFEPLSENPVFTFDLGSHKTAGRLLLTGVDNNGNKINAWIGQ